MEYLIKIVHILFTNTVIDFPCGSFIKDYVDIVTKILTGVIAILGLGYLKPLKEKTVTATFNFWSQLRTRLKRISQWLKSNDGLLDNMYSDEAKDSWESHLTPAKDKIVAFKNLVEDTIKYAENANDQMPAYIGWSDDYNKLLETLSDMLIYDISNCNSGFKFTTTKTDKERKEFCEDICNTINRICDGIELKQKSIEVDIFKH